MLHLNLASTTQLSTFVAQDHPSDSALATVRKYLSLCTCILLT